MIRVSAFEKERLAQLRATQELGGVSERGLLSLLPYIDEVTVPAGTTLAVAGRPCMHFFVVLSGAVSGGDTVGWNAMWERGFNQQTVRAETDVRLLVMGHAQFRAVKALPGASEVRSHELPAPPEAAIERCA